VPQNYPEAAKWFRKAAEQGYANAQYALGVCYYIGYGVTPNKAVAIKWFKKAAQQGLADAQKALKQLGESW
jgi:TPR repeat protein